MRTPCVKRSSPFGVYKAFRSGTGKHNLRLCRRLEKSAKGTSAGKRERAAGWFFIAAAVPPLKTSLCKTMKSPERFISGGLFRTVFEKSLAPKLFRSRKWRNKKETRVNTGLFLIGNIRVFTVRNPRRPGKRVQPVCLLPKWGGAADAAHRRRIRLSPWRILRRRLRIFQKHPYSL